MGFPLIDSYTHILSDYHNVFLWWKYWRQEGERGEAWREDGVGKGLGGGAAVK